MPLVAARRDGPAQWRGVAALRGACRSSCSMAAWGACRCGAAELQPRCRGPSAGEAQPCAGPWPLSPRPALPPPSSLLPPRPDRGGARRDGGSNEVLELAGHLSPPCSSLLPSLSLAAAAGFVPARVLRRRPWRGSGRAARGARGAAASGGPRSGAPSCRAPGEQLRRGRACAAAGEQAERARPSPLLRASARSAPPLDRRRGPPLPRP